MRLRLALFATAGLLLATALPARAQVGMTVGSPYTSYTASPGGWGWPGYYGSYSTATGYRFYDPIATYYPGYGDLFTPFGGHDTYWPTGVGRTTYYSSAYSGLGPVLSSYPGFSANSPIYPTGHTGYYSHYPISTPGGLYSSTERFYYYP